MRGGIGSVKHRFRPRAVGIVDGWMDSRFGNDTLSYSGGAGSKTKHQPIGERASGDKVSPPFKAVSTPGIT